jgi:adenylate cyclase
MQLTMAKVNAQNSELGLPPIEMGVGLNTGDTVVGNIGSPRRAKYGVVGRHVNLASRIESYTLGGQIFAAESTVEDAGDGVVVNGQMEIAPKGIAGPMTIYDIGGVGAPYDRHLIVLDDDALTPLHAPLAVRVVILQGKSARGDGQPGELVALSSRVGRIRAAGPVAPMQNVKIELRADGLLGVELWGKTIAPRASASAAGDTPGGESDTFDVWFVSIPDELRACLD